MRAEALRGELVGDNCGWDDDSVQDTAQVTCLLFRLGPRIFAVDVRAVREVLVVCEILPLPNSPADVVGMIDLRDQGIAIVDLAARLGMVPEPGEEARIIVFEIQQGDSTVSLGVVADQVLRVLEVGDEDVEPVAQTGSDWQGDGVEGLLRTEDGSALVLKIERFLVARDGVGEFDFG